MMRVLSDDSWASSLARDMFCIDEETKVKLTDPSVISKFRPWFLFQRFLILDDEQGTLLSLSTFNYICDELPGCNTSMPIT